MIFLSPLVPAFALSLPSAAPASESFAPLPDFAAPVALSTSSFPLEPTPSVQSSERSPWYFTVGANLVTTEASDGPSEEIDFDEGYGFNFALGRRYLGDLTDGFAWDVEFEVVWTDQDADDDPPLRAVRDVNSATALINALAAIELSQRVEFFAGGGLGLGWLSVGTESDNLNAFEEEDGPFLAWQLRAGLRYAATEALDVELGYRLLNIDDAEIDDSIGNADFDLETQQHALGLGLRFGV